ncbi:MAG: acetate kinase [Oscillospiraceae bacterium]|jgi:acetate kinase|nr:acetate kinase [Oscillospiraceae bacterium]
MNILVINAGSSSLKYQLIEMNGEKVVAKGNCERIGIDGKISHSAFDGRKFEEDCPFATHTEAFEKVVYALTESPAAVISGMSEINAVGHRIVQGAEVFNKTTAITDDIIRKIDELKELAPVHNHAHALALWACKKVIPESVPQAAVFDTAFHQTIPDYAFIYGMPYECYGKYNVRKYGFHGTSHRFVTMSLAQRMGRDIKDLKIVSCHLGNGSSITAVYGGKSVDTSMGFTPLDGVLMGTRSGAVDPSAVTYIQKKLGLSPAETDDYLNKKSGLLGIGGFSDNREITAAAEKGDRRAMLATAILRYGIKKYIGAYTAAMGGLDAVIFTGGIGENAVDIRRDVCLDMEFFGIEFDVEKNANTRGSFEKITKDGSRAEVWVVPTDEELLIARDTKELFGL